MCIANSILHHLHKIFTIFCSLHFLFSLMYISVTNYFHIYAMQLAIQGIIYERPVVTFQLNFSCLHNSAHTTHVIQIFTFSRIHDFTILFCLFVFFFEIFIIFHNFPISTRNFMVIRFCDFMIFETMKLRNGRNMKFKEKSGNHVLR